MKNKAYILAGFIFLTFQLFGMNQLDNKDLKIKIDPITINSLVSEVASVIIDNQESDKLNEKIVDDISEVGDKATSKALQDLLDKTKKNEASLRKKNNCLVITTGIVALVSPVLTTILTSGGSVLLEKGFDILGKNCTCY